MVLLSSFCSKLIWYKQLLMLTAFVVLYTSIFDTHLNPLYTLAVGGSPVHLMGQAAGLIASVAIIRVFFDRVM